MSTIIGASSYLMASGAMLAGTHSTSAYAMTAGSGRTTFEMVDSRESDVPTYPFTGPFFARDVKDTTASAGAADTAMQWYQTMVLTEHRDAGARKQAAEKLATLSNPTVTGVLAKAALGDTDMIVRLAAVGSLQSIGGKDAAMDLARIAIESGCEKTQSAAIDSCRSLSNDSIDIARTVARRLIGKFRKGDMQARWKAARLLGQLKSFFAAEALSRTAMQDARIVVRLRAIKSLEEIGSDNAVRCLVTIAANSDCEQSRAQAINGCRFLCDSDPSMKTLIRMKLGAIGNDNAIAALDLLPR